MLEWIGIGVKWGFIVSCAIVTMFILLRSVFFVLAIIEGFLTGGDEVASNGEEYNEKAESGQDDGSHTP